LSMNAIVYTRTEAIPAQLVERDGHVCRLKGFYEEVSPDGILLVELRDGGSGDSKILFESCEVVEKDHPRGRLTVRASSVTDLR
jgi:hypothetical protein